MKLVKFWALAVFCIFTFSIGVSAQDNVIIYNAPDFQGANIPISGNWNGGNGFDRIIKSIRVPNGYRVTIYDKKDFKGTQAVLTEDWNPGAGAWWTSRVRSIRVDRAQIQPLPPVPPATGDFPVIYAQPNYQGPAMAVERDWTGSRDWNGSPHQIRSIRVPNGWRLTLYEKPNFGGAETRITSNISWGTGDHWNGRVRSIRVQRAQIEPPIKPSPPSPSGFPVIYAQENFQGPAEAVERDFAGSKDWEGSPHRIRSIRVPQGWYLVLYDKRNFRGKSYNLNSDWMPQPGDYWYGRIKSIKVYKGTPPKQPR